MILLQNVSKQYKGMETGNDSGVALWVKNIIRLTSNKAAELLAVDNVSFGVEKGEILGIYGSNGAGKTTLIKLLSGLLYPTSGTVAIDGRTDSKHIKNTVSYISTNGWMGLEWQLTARENLILYGNMFGISGKKLGQACDDTLQAVGMTEAKNKYISQLSAGMRQKITISRGLILNRPIIFYDEPSVSLDVQSAKNLRQLIRSDATQNKRTAIIASHNQEDLSVCDRILMLSHGKIIAAGTPDELISPLAGTQIIELKIPRQEREVRFESIRGIESVTCGDVDEKRDYQSVKIRARRADFNLNALIDFVIDSNIAVLSIKNIEPSLHEAYEYHRNGGEADYAVS